MNATYSLEDNKLRMYSAKRLDPDLYKRVRESGFIWAPKQELFVAPMWTPGREALLIELCESIENEESTLEQRAIDRADRFDNYSAKRGQDATRAADAADAMSEPFANGQPILIGHHSQRKAENLRDRIQSTMKKAVNFYDCSNYWASRSEGVLSNVAYKAKPDVRVRRIKGLESDMRRSERNLAEYDKYDKFLNAPEMTVDIAIVFFNYSNFTFNLTEGDRVTYGFTYEHQTTASAYDLLKRGYPLETLKNRMVPTLERNKAHSQKWVDHYSMRINYEREMLKASGHAMPDFKAISAERRKVTTSAPIVNTPDLNMVVKHGSEDVTLRTFSITKEQFKKLGALDNSCVRRSKCGGFRYRIAMAMYLKDLGFEYKKDDNERYSSVVLFISDQKHVEVPV